MITADYHVHSLFSSDSDTPMEAMVEQAISMGLTHICFTDHMDLDFPECYQLRFQFDPDAYFKKLAQIRERYGQNIQILQGIEIGMMPGLSKRYDHLLSSYPFDFVIASTHLIDHIDPYYPEFWEGRTTHEAMMLYFQSVLHAIESFQNFDVYGHLDYIGRYAPDKGKAFSLADYSEIIDDILKILIHYNKGIEVNTAGYKYGMGHPNPHEDIIRRYLELGGHILTIGSDGHKPEHLAYGFSQAKQVLESIGVKEYMIFQGRNYTTLPLSDR